MRSKIVLQGGLLAPTTVTARSLSRHFSNRAPSSRSGDFSEGSGSGCTAKTSGRAFPAGQQGTFPTNRNCFAVIGRENHLQAVLLSEQR